MECKFRVGQKVVCVRTIVDGQSWGEELPTAGHIYTVRAVEVRLDIPAILLAEIINRPMRYCDGVREMAFQHFHFRPIHETQINELRQIAIDAFKSKKVTA